MSQRSSHYFYQTKGNWAYFKSTDGHFNNWSFNLRRPNLHLLSTLSTHSGSVVFIKGHSTKLMMLFRFIIVDSTRSGKRLPDALSKTVPIWCAVVNRAVVLRKLVNSSTAWDHSLYTPPASVSAQERAQIESKIENWALELAVS
jgi:tRNA A64-2'-O-ribosylphosphate transferase